MRLACANRAATLPWLARPFRLYFFSSTYLRIGTARVAVVMEVCDRTVQFQFNLVTGGFFLFFSFFFLIFFDFFSSGLLFYFSELTRKVCCAAASLDGGGE